jgi:hypothetical protein
VNEKIFNSYGVDLEQQTRDVLIKRVVICILVLLGVAIFICWNELKKAQEAVIEDSKMIVSMQYS